MKKKRYSKEQIIAIVKQSEAGRRVSELARGARRERGHDLGLEVEVWRHGGGRRQAASWLGGREPAAEADGGRSLLRQIRVEERDPKQRVELAGLRRDVAHAVGQHGIRERRACKLVGIERMSYRYEPRPDHNAAPRRSW